MHLLTYHLDPIDEVLNFMVATSTDKILDLICHTKNSARHSIRGNLFDFNYNIANQYAYVLQKESPFGPNVKVIFGYDLELS